MFGLMIQKTKGLAFIICVLAFHIFSCTGKKGTDGSGAVRDTTEVGRKIADLSLRIADDPENAALFHERAQLNLQRNDVANAMLDMEQVMKRDTTVPAYFLTLADVHLAATKPGRSRAALEKCLSLDPKNKLAYEKLAELYFIAQQYKESIANLDEVLKLDITNPKAYFMKGMCFRDMGDTSRAISSFQTAVEQKPDYYEAELQLAILFHAQKNPLALQYYNAALRMNPKGKDALYNRGLWYQDVEGNNDQAIQDYTSAVTIDPGFALAHFALGFLHYQNLKVYDQAIRHYNDAIKIQPGWAEAYYNRGLCFEAQGNIAAAGNDYSKALEIYPEYSAARDGKARVSR